MTQFKTTEDGKALLWTGDGEYLRIEPWGSGAARPCFYDEPDLVGPGLGPPTLQGPS